MNSLVQFLILHWMDILVNLSAAIGALILLLQAFIAIFILIPGPQPEATMQKIIDLLKKGKDLVEKVSKK